ncbi:MAG: pyridoxine 5'-phosphate synthase [Proteobacteria bacterium]|nr:pyridoxine 5'-phosphate synthase [Pseudomonadota bacterium]
MKLGVNIDHVGTLRQVRGVSYPDVAAAAEAAEAGGADFITVHLREDRRHVIDSDLPRLAAVVQTHINLEIAVTDEMREIAMAYKPASICLVPEKREELTTEGGLDVVGHLARVRDFVTTLSTAGSEVSLFIDPEEAQIAAAVQCGAPAIELHTGRYAADGNLQPLKHAAAVATAAGLKVNAGHGLTLENVAAVCTLPVTELNIGHSIIARAVFVGLAQAVAEMRQAMGLAAITIPRQSQQP